MFVKREYVETMLENAQIITDGEYSGYCTEDININKIPSITDVPDKVTDLQEIKNVLHTIAYLQKTINHLYLSVSDDDMLASLCSWKVTRLYENCRIIKGDLYSDKTLLCKKDGCLITNFGNAYRKNTYIDETTGVYCYSMFIEVSPEIFVEISCET